MTFATVSEGLIFLAFVVLLGVVLVRDVTSYTIPNGVVLAITALFLPAFLLHTGDVQFLSHLLAGLAVLIPGWVLFHFRMFGGGDVKAWAAIALWYGLENLAPMVVAIAVIGGALGITLLLVRGLLPPRTTPSGANRHRLRDARIWQRGAPIPYGLAIAAGTVLTINKIPLFANLPMP
jgi:prepilin peptidase CpaA